MSIIYGCTQYLLPGIRIDRWKPKMLLIETTENTVSLSDFMVRVSYCKYLRQLTIVLSWFPQSETEVKGFYNS